MARRISIALMLSLLVVAFLAMSAGAAQKPVEERQVLNPLINRVEMYSFPDEHDFSVSTGSIVPTQPLGGTDRLAVSPGVKVGETWYDYQRNGSMRRMINWGWGPDLGDGEVYGLGIHFSYMMLPTSLLEDRHIYYNCYMGQTGTQLQPGLGQSVQPGGDYAGYCGIDVTQVQRTEGETILQAANQGVIICHNNPGAGYASQAYYDGGPMWNYWAPTSRVPDSVQTYATSAGVEDIWPAMRYHDVAGHDPVTHIIAQSSNPNAGDPQAIYYFRKVGIGASGAWVYPPYVIDTIYDLSQDVACSMTDGKMALVWTGNLPNDGDCDTCSGTSPFVQLDNDIYYQISDNYGADFNPRVNVTKNVDGEAGFRPYTDLSCLITQDAANGVNALHIGWSGRVWPADANSGGFIGLRCRMFHWGENLGTGGFDGPDPQTDNAIIRTVSNLDWDQTTCNGGAWQMNGSKMTISECNGRLYFLHVQFNDPNIMMDDCAERGMTGADVVGSANGELYLTVSDDGGLTWDLSRNLTNSHTPGCDSASGTGGRCESDHWPSMARFGTNIVGDDMTGAEILLPAGDLAVDNGWYMSVQYISDPDAGAIVQNEGSWQNANVQSFQLVCVDPEATPLLAPSWTSIGFPSWSHQYVIHDTDLVLENTGNSAATFTVTPEEDEGPAGWLDVSGNLQGTVVLPSGLAGIMTGQVYINALGTAGGPSATVTYLAGRLILTGDHIGSPTTIEIEHWVADTVITPVWDTIYAGSGSKYTACMALSVANNGNWGQQGIGHVNMDYFDYGDCDDAEEGSVGDTIPGDATHYIYDASPVICWMDATDTVRCNWSIFGDGYLSDNGFFPWSHTPPTDMGDYEVFQSSFVTRDSGIMFENSWIAPRAAVDSCHFLIQYMKVYAQDGETHTGLAIGEGMDWDIVSDSGSRNRSGFDADLRLMYQQGSEWDQDDAYECMDNSDRYGGIELLQILENGEPAGEQYGCYTMDNSTQVYPTAAFVPDSMYMYMANNEGYVLSDSVDADLHAVMTFRWNYTLAPGDVLEVYKCMITSNVNYAAFIADAEGCHRWYADHLQPNWPPELEPINPGGEPIVFVFGGPNTINVSASDNNELDEITLTAVPDPAMPGHQWTDNHNGTGVFTWSPTANEAGGVYTITFTADDGKKGRAIDFEVVDVIVEENFAPVLVIVPDDDPVVFQFEELNTINVSATDDNIHDVISLTAVPDPAMPGSNWEDNGDGTGAFTWTPTLEDVGLYTITFTADDGHAKATDVEIVNVEVVAGCCKMRGDINHDGLPLIDISDLVYLVDYMFVSGPEPPCFEEADVNGDGLPLIDISDLVYLVDYMFVSGPPPPPC